MLREEYDTKRDGDNESRDSGHATDCRVSLHNAYQLHLRGLVFFDHQAHSAMKDGYGGSFVLSVQKKIRE